MLTADDLYPVYEPLKMKIKKPSERSYRIIIIIACAVVIWHRPLADGSIAAGVLSC